MFIIFKWNQVEDKVQRLLWGITTMFKYYYIIHSIYYVLLYQVRQTLFYDMSKKRVSDYMYYYVNTYLEYFIIISE